ncbi:MAG TPA: DUF5335 family protein [Pyrinomonadaceae bacterium]|jgi:hypothetical protein
MGTREIPRNEWRSFFDVFSRQHEGWLATLEILGREVAAKQEPRESAFKGITLTSVVGESEALAINLGKTPEDHVKHTVIEPKHVLLVQTSEGANAALEIESADETKTLLRFRSALLPEFVDGVVLE